MIKPEGKLKPKAERFAVLLRWCALHHGCDVLNGSAVESYVDATGAQCSVMPYGADKCPLMGKDLSGMAVLGLLARYRTGIHGVAGMGFPSWVWVYRITDKGRAELAEAIKREPPAVALTKGKK